MRRLGLTMFLLLLCGGCEEQVYVCKSDAACLWLGVQGICLPTGPASYCAFPETRCDPNRIYTGSTTCCDSGWRWHESAPMLIENKCVDPALVQAHGGATPGGAMPASDMMSHD